MELKAQDYYRQVHDAKIVHDTYLRDWEKRVRLYRPEYIADGLFHRTMGDIAQMLASENDQGFVYDPKILKDGVEMLVKILEAQENYKNNDPKVKVMYTRFGTPELRIKYLRRIADKLDIYSSIGDLVIEDLLEVAKTTTDKEFLEFLPNIIRNIQQRAEMEKKTLEEKRNNRQRLY